MLSSEFNESELAVLGTVGLRNKRPQLIFWGILVTVPTQKQFEITSDIFGVQYTSIRQNNIRIMSIIKFFLMIIDISVLKETCIH
jgi:hypothetical protein